MFSRFAQLIKYLLKVRQDEVNEKFVLAAFVGFQMGAAGGEKTFGEYLYALGLSDKLPQQVRGKVDETRKLARMGVKRA